VMRPGAAKQRAIDIKQHERPSRSHSSMVLTAIWERRSRPASQPYARSATPFAPAWRAQFAQQYIAPPTSIP
jgi:hypothetical protein